MTSPAAIIGGVAYVSGGLAAVGCLYVLAASLFALRFRRLEQGGKGSETWPAVTVMVPLCGDEPGLSERLRRLRRQAYPGPVEVVCGVRDATDPAVAAARSVAAEEAGWPLDLHIDPRLYGRNLKISNLINTLEHARHDVLVMVDSDMELPPDYLARIIDELEKPGVGAVTCLYHGVARGGLAARLSAMGINLHFLPNAVFGLRMRMTHPCFGATIALSRDQLERIGGLRAFADQLWDDYAIGRAVRTTGKQVAVGAAVPAHICTETSLRRLFAGQLRAARTIRGIDPAGHVGAVITHPLPFALFALCLTGAWWAAALTGAALACRIVLGTCVSRRFGAPRPPLALVPLRDLLSFAIYVASFFGATVEWRGQRYRVGDNGTLISTANRG
ncbi:MAG TPA: bacteriohopanetetrol glucosamine biosynthesis glycosyltransferase HpnI [Pararhizobium sp.]|nr:bacteriohopanetetrol glucosamine biosynthesis glycosyltransferase HpnI [Pararhizobium sp.]